MKHDDQTMTLSQIVNLISDYASDRWFRIVGIRELVAMEDAACNLADDDGSEAAFDALNVAEHAYLDAHGNDLYVVSWPEHVIYPRLNGDATFHPQSTTPAEQKMTRS